LTTYYDHPSIDRFNTGKYTSSGEVFDADDPTRASSSNFPDGTELLMRNPLNGRAIHVRVNDFGPFHTTRQLDLTRAGAQALGFVDQGVLRLDAMVVAPPPDGEPRYKRNRRYPPALGYVGILDDREANKLSKLLINDRAARRLTNVHIINFLRSHRQSDPLALLPVGQMLQVSSQFPTILAAVIDKTLVAQTQPARILVDGSISVSPPPGASGPPLPQRNSTRAHVRRIRLATADTIPYPGWRDESPATAAPRTGETSPPVEIATDAAFLDQGRQIALRALPGPKPFEVAVIDSGSIRMNVPGLHGFMSIMAPHWGPKVTPPQALGGVVGIAFVLLILTWASLELRIAQPVYAGMMRRVDQIRYPRPFSASARIAAPVGCPIDAAMSATPRRDWIEPPAMIPRGVRVEGVVTAKRPLLIAGHVKGECRCESLVVGRQGSVEGSVQTAEVVIYGQVTGTIRTRRLRVEDGAIVEGEVFQRTLDVKPQAELQATIHRLPAAAE